MAFCFLKCFLILLISVMLICLVKSCCVFCQMERAGKWTACSPFIQTMQGVNHREELGSSVLLKDTSTCAQEKPGVKPPTCSTCRALHLVATIILSCVKILTLISTNFQNKDSPL